MILKASQRGGGAQLARHLLNDTDNDHVRVHELRGFVASDLHGAFKEAHAISRGTRCRQFLFSLSLSPPETAKVPIEVFEKAIVAIEAKVGLSGQPRAIVFHEKEGRRHAHCVWSRIDARRMKAINLPHFKLKLQDMSRRLYLEHDWKMPQGLVSRNQHNPLNFTLAEWQQAKRASKDPRAIKQAFQECWTVSDSLKGFARALKERGYYLAKGDRRGFVALDWHGEVYSIARMIGRKSKEVVAKLREPDNLPAVDLMRRRIAEDYTGKLKSFAAEAANEQDTLLEEFAVKRQTMTDVHRAERENQRLTQKDRRQNENAARAARLPRGLKALLFRLTGRYKAIKNQNALEAAQCERRDRAEMQALIDRQLKARRILQNEKRLILHRVSVIRRRLELEMRDQRLQIAGVAPKPSGKIKRARRREWD
ncbi:relaxase/mobilization nuclease domain-containing protein [Stappia sp. ES.058]|uniref:relaxase/mobilization nuclease domain-containing protein n=1 Tax=Stappia sp. ES.058 TaxID=1881061 RepID=UPI00087A6FB1|nr:relaxase/mobilization nuclease domain-containing protein [Stappia sp. ES.058]SDU42736.1 hypothetical protein SAMN05428979_3719 [Stappia sp. ES.058]